MRELGKLLGMADRVKMCEGGVELAAVQLLMWSAVGMGVARELGGGAVLENRLAES
jgi:hypothetical protein